VTDIVDVQTRRNQRKDRRTHPIANKWMYRLNSRFNRNDGLVFMNWGYEEDPPAALPLAESDEPNRYSIQLYDSVASQVDLTGKRVLEVSCGHGGGASYLVRTQHPESYTGLDLNPVGLEFCRRKHQLPGLDFVEGNAEKLPFPDQSFDVVINVEASHCYPQFSQFLNEVARVLRPGGHFLYADVRRSGEIAKWDEDLADAPMRLLSKREINEQVARGLEKLYPVMVFNIQSFLGALFNFALWRMLYRRLLHNRVSYRMYCFANG
jgi:ubiquinone/menaquinone biosynthesis C-methylase UbiE